jgi:ParB family transcriptional regulator, chromosome partitioning protein
MKAKPRLGKGIDALIPVEEHNEVSHVVVLSLDEIRPNPIQPRKSIDRDKLAELSESIKVHGLISPILVRKFNTKYEIIAGERRFHACKMAGIDRVPVIVKDVSDDDSFRLSLIENLQREDLNPMEETEAYYTLKEQFGLTHHEIAESVMKDRSTVTNALRLIALPDEMKAALREGAITPGHARAILMLDNEASRLSLFNTIVKKGISVREAERYASNNRQKKELVKKTDSALESLSSMLSNHFSARVICSWSKRKGKITIEVSSRDELNRVVDELTKSVSPL